MKKATTRLSFVFVILAFLNSCSLFVDPTGKTTENLKDISQLIDYGHVRALAFMGGSIYFDPANPSACPVVAGARIGFRLGHTERKNISDSRALFKDLPEESCYGVLTVVAVSADGISLQYELFDAQGQIARSDLRGISRGETIDIDGDGLGDISWEKPKRKRPGLESATYLTFESSKENLNTTMFSLIPEQYSRGLYPNGVMGINPNGQFIFQKYEGQSASRSLVRGALYGDFVQDNRSGSYQRIVEAPRGGSARSLGDTALETIESTVPTSFYFNEAEFYGESTALALLAAIPSAVKGQGTEALDEGSCRDRLNALLERSDLISAFSRVQESPIPSEHLPKVMASIGTLSHDELVHLNRLYIEKSYPELCPAILANDDSISEIFPLLSCVIQNPEANPGADADAAGARTAGASRAASSAEYDTQKAVIEGRWVKYHQILDLTDTKLLKALSDRFSSGSTGASASATTASGGVDTPRFTPFEKFFVGTMDFLFGIPYTRPEDVPASYLQNLKEMKTDAYGYIDLLKFTSNSSSSDALGAINVKMGLYGYFSCTWGNIEGAAALATFIQADTNVRLNASLTNGNIGAGGTIDLGTINYSLIDAPPIVIGVVAVKCTLNGGFSLPIQIQASAEVSTGVRFAFTGLYGAEAGVGANYGINWTTVRIAWWDVTVPSGTYCTPYTIGRPVNESAYYAGPSGSIALNTTRGLEGSSLSFAITPTIFLEPRVVFNDVLFVGIRGSVGNEFKFTLSTESVPNQWYPTIHGVGTAALVGSIGAQGGLSFVIPIVNYRQEVTVAAFTIWKDRKVYFTWNPF